MVAPIDVWVAWDRDDGTPTVAGFWEHNFDREQLLKECKNLFVSRSQQKADAELKRRKERRSKP